MGRGGATDPPFRRSPQARLQGERRVGGVWAKRKCGGGRWPSEAVVAWICSLRCLLWKRWV